MTCAYKPRFVTGRAERREPNTTRDLLDRSLCGRACVSGFLCVYVCSSVRFASTTAKRQTPEQQQKNQSSMRGYHFGLTCRRGVWVVIVSQIEHNTHHRTRHKQTNTCSMQCGWRTRNTRLATKKPRVLWFILVCQLFWRRVHDVAPCLASIFL